MCATNLSYFYIIFKQLNRADYTRTEQAERQQQQEDTEHIAVDGGRVEYSCAAKSNTANAKTKTTNANAQNANTIFERALTSSAHRITTKTGAGTILLIFL